MSKPNFDLSGKVALITGGNGGIGLGMAEAIAAAGGALAIWGTNPDKNAQADGNPAGPWDQSRKLGLRCLRQGTGRGAHG